MVIHELSFCSIEPFTDLPFHSHRIDLLRAIPPGELQRELGSLANRLRRETGYEVVAGGRGNLLGSAPLDTCETFRILEIESIDLTDAIYSSYLKQVLNRSVAKYFQGRDLKVNIYAREAFSRKLTFISSDVEAQRYLKWDIRIDGNKYIFLSIDYSNEYRDRQNAYMRGIEGIPFNQPLVHTYDSKTCRFASVADFTVATPLESLGNISLLEYHRRQGIVAFGDLDAIPPSTRAVQVNYGSQGKDIIYPHIPQLLKKAFSRDDVDAKKFNEQVWSIDKRFKEAIQGIEKLNEVGGLQVLERQVVFQSHPYCPQLQTNFVELAKEKGFGQNLDFGDGVFGSFPSQGLNRKQLLEKPENIKAIVFYPNGENPQAWCQAFAQHCRSFKINLELLEYRAYPIGDILGTQRKCRNMQNFDIALMCVPDKEEYRSRPTADPYPILKREFIQVMMPSQGIELSTIRSQFRGSTGDNLLLGVLGKLGHSPWQLRSIPGKAQAFIGLDVGRKDGRAVGASAFVVNQFGRVIGWSAADFQSHRETFDLAALRRIIFGLVNLFEQQNQTQLTHLVIHRDGQLQNDELELLEELLPELAKAGVEKVDIVEILKSGYDRAGQYNDELSIWENPQRGWSWAISEDEVVLMTTGVREIKGGTNFVPRPITVRRRKGETRVGILAAQVYWLSEMHIGSTQTVRLPITTYYADAAAEYALEGLLPSGVQIARRLPFL